MRLVALCLAIAALASCGRPDAVADGANNSAALPALNAPEPSPAGAPPANLEANRSTATRPPPAVATKIPVALQGRWGLTPRDCTSSLGDAKGLLVINGSELRFYESRAVPSADAQTSADSIAGTFDFTGEGQTWSKYEAVQLQDGKLMRTERDPLASFTYARCT
jgi:hypothetical protein